MFININMLSQKTASVSTPPDLSFNEPHFLIHIKIAVPYINLYGVANPTTELEWQSMGANNSVNERV